MMIFEDLIATTSTITEPNAQSVYGKILGAVITVINAFGYFYETKVIVRDDEILRPPVCVVIPSSIRTTEQQLGGGSGSRDFTIQVAYALKNPNDSIVTDLTLFYTEAILNLFSHKEGGGAGVFKFAAISEHYNTQIEANEIGAIHELRNGVLAYNSGINVVFSVWYT